jgi:hypothetical protein
LHAGASRLLDTHLPCVSHALAAAGGVRFSQLTPLPPPIAQTPPQPGDDQFLTLTGRRPVLEYAFASVAEQVVDVRRGSAVTELLCGPSALSGVPHVTGLRTADGERIDADLVIDASGRQSVLPRWLTALGARPPLQEAEDSAFFYYTRYFHSPSGHPEPRVGLLTPYGSISLLTLPADNNTWSVTIYTSSRDRALRAARRAEVWTHIVQACPLQAHWLDGQPITDIVCMSGTLDRYRRFTLDNTPSLPAWSPSATLGMQQPVGRQRHPPRAAARVAIARRRPKRTRYYRIGGRKPGAGRRSAPPSLTAIRVMLLQKLEAGGGRAAARQLLRSECHRKSETRWGRCDGVAVAVGLTVCRSLRSPGPGRNGPTPRG